MASIKRWFKDNPRTVFLVVVAVVLLGLFLGVITPLFATAGPAMADISGVIPNAATAGDVFIASATNTMSSVADVAVGSYLRAGGVGTAPLWSTVTLPNTVNAGDVWVASFHSNGSSAVRQDRPDGASANITPKSASERSCQDG